MFKVWILALIMSIYPRQEQIRLLATYADGATNVEGTREQATVALILLIARQGWQIMAYGSGGNEMGRG